MLNIKNRNKRVFIVDFDAISPIGIGRNDIYQNLERDYCNETVLEEFSNSNIPFFIGAKIPPVKDVNFPNDLFAEIALYDRKFYLLYAIFQLMRERLELMCNLVPTHKKGVVLGVGADVIPFHLFSKEVQKSISANKNPYNELIINLNKEKGFLNTIWNPYDIHSLFIAEQLSLGAFQKTILTACTASTQAILSGYYSIQNCMADMVVVGGTDSILNPLAFISFGKLGVIPEHNDMNSNTCKPFDMNRNGTLAGEAAGLAILASEEVCRSHNLQPKYELKGGASTLDAYKITAPDPGGVSIEKCLHKCLQHANWKPGDVDYIHAHGTGTKLNDSIELKAIHKVFGEKASEVPISSTKDRHGHAIGAAGVQELVVSLLALDNGFIPSNRNLQTPLKPEMNLVRKNRKKQLKRIIMNNFAFGGVNTVLAIENQA